MPGLSRRNWSRGGGVPGLLAGEAVERVEHGDAVFGGCGGVGADGGEVFRAFHGAHASGYLLSCLGHPDLPLGRVVVEAYGEVLSLIHISEPTRRTPISYAVFCLKKKKK